MLIDIWNLPYLGPSPYSPAYPSGSAVRNEDRICRVLRDNGLTWMIAHGMSNKALLKLPGMGRTLVRHFREVARYHYGNYSVFRPMGNRQKMEEAARSLAA